MSEYNKAKKRYAQIQYREFERLMELFIFYKDFKIKIDDSTVLKDFDDSVRDNHKRYEYTREFILLNQNIEDVKELDFRYKGFNDFFYKSNKFYEIFETAFKEQLSIKDFCDKFGHDDKDRKCEYCHITENRIKKLFDEKRLNTKRLWSRGLIMEVDRKEPLDGYHINNIALCCYWCNNAKSDEFKYDEFINRIRKGFTTTWNDRINAYNKNRPDENRLKRI